MSLTSKAFQPDSILAMDNTPAGRPAEIRSARENKIQSFPRLGGPHHHYAVAA